MTTERQLTSWPQAGIRIVGAIAIIIGLLDAYSLWLAVPRRFGNTAQYVHTTAAVVHGMFVINATLCLALIACAVAAFVLPRRATTALSVLCAIELVYLLFLFLIPPTTEFGQHIGAAFGIGMVGLDFQVFSAFPIWGLLVCVLARRAMNRADSPK
jgi:hypothetical protein